MMYLTTCTRPDIAYSVGRLARFLDCYTNTHWKHAKQVLRYLKATKNHGLWYSGKEELLGFTDSDWAGDQQNSKSTSGYVFTYGGACVSWKSQLQRVVAQSTAEAEYIAANGAAKEGIWLQSLISNLSGNKCTTFRVCRIEVERS